MSGFSEFLPPMPYADVHTIARMERREKLRKALMIRGGLTITVKKFEAILDELEVVVNEEAAKPDNVRDYL